MALCGAGSALCPSAGGTGDAANRNMPREAAGSGAGCAGVGDPGLPGMADSGFQPPEIVLSATKGGLEGQDAIGLWLDDAATLATQKRKRQVRSCTAD